MDKKNTVIIIGSLILSGVAVAYFYKKFINKNSDLSLIDKNTPEKIKSILFIGDSNTEANWSYADKIKKMYPNITVKKIAKHSMKTDWMLNELQSELSKNKYNVVSVLGGSNDIYATGKNDSVKANLEKMYQISKNADAKFVIVAPPNKNFYAKATASKQDSLKDLLNWEKNIANKDYFIDFWTITNNKNLFSKGDGFLHPQSDAHNILAKDFSEKLNIK
jgi:hypothetical protein